MDLIKGRAAVNKYRKIHNEKKEHPVKELIADLKDAGFESINEFFKFNEEEINREL